MDLDPEKYNLNEVTGFFNLNPNHTFTQINDAFRRKHNEVTLSNNLSGDEKSRMCSFFEQLKNKLVLNLTTSDVLHNEFNGSLNMGSLSSSNSSNYDKIDDHVDTVINSQIVYPHGASKEISAGVMNPIERNIIKNVIHIDTRFKQNYVVEGNTKFTIKLPTSFKNVIALNLQSFEPPSFMYNFTTSLENTTFKFALGTNAYQDLIIDEGKYTTTTLATELQRVINANANISGITVAVGDDTGKLSFTHTSSDFKVKFPLINNKLNLGFILGFTKTEYTKTAVGSRVLVAEKILDIGFNNYYYFSLNDYQGSANQPHYAVVNKNFVTKNIFAKLKKTSYENTDYFVQKKYFGPVTLERFTFEILDKYGNPIDLKGVDYSFSLEIDILYQF